MTEPPTKVQHFLDKYSTTLTHVLKYSRFYFNLACSRKKNSRDYIGKTVLLSSFNFSLVMKFFIT